MPATATIHVDTVFSASPPAGTANSVDLSPEPVDLTFNATTNTIGQVIIDPDDAITGDPQTVIVALMSSTNAFTADASTDKLADTAHGLSDAALLRLATSGTLPAPLDPDTYYYVVNAATNDFKVALTPGGTAIDITTTGTGTPTWQNIGPAVLTYTYPTSGPARAVRVIQNVTGDPDDFNTVRALQIVFRPLDPATAATGIATVTAGDPADPYNYFSVTLTLDYDPAEDGSTVLPVWTAALPQGLPWDPDFPLTVAFKDGTSNSNGRLLINLLGK